jgi:hypothetical protein
MRHDAGTEVVLCTLGIHRHCAELLDNATGSPFSFIRVEGAILMMPHGIDDEADLLRIVWPYIVHGPVKQ